MLLHLLQRGGLVTITIKFHVRAPFAGRKVRYRAAEYSDLRNGCNKSALAYRQRTASQASQIADERRPRKFRLAIGNFRMAVICVESANRRSILVGLLKAYPRVRTVARPEDCIEVRRRDELKISRGPMRLLRVSPPTKLCAVSRFTMYLR